MTPVVPVMPSRAKPPRLAPLGTTGTTGRPPTPCPARSVTVDAPPGTCDRCRRPAELIHPGAIALGPVLLTFGLCPRCLAHTEPTRKGNRS